MCHVMTLDQTRYSHIRALGVLVAACLLVPAATTQAQGFISPLVGYNFGGDSGCPNVTNCSDKRLNVGVGLGVMGDLFGFEEEFAYANNFFGEAPAYSSSVLTLMTNVMVVPKLSPVRPYALVGVGLIKTHVDPTAASLLSSDNNNFGWDLGGGVMVLFGEHVGVRGDIRYFHSFQDLNLLGLTISDSKLDFGRASAALVLTF